MSGQGHVGLRARHGQVSVGIDHSQSVLRRVRYETSLRYPRRRKITGTRPLASTGGRGGGRSGREAPDGMRVGVMSVCGPVSLGLSGC